MGYAERQEIREILLGLDPETERLFRLNAGQGWVGEVIRHTESSVILRNPRAFHGLPEGTPDLGGFKSIMITPEMVGQRVAVLWMVEVKAGAKNPSAKLSRRQKLARKLLERMGAIYEVRG